MKAICASDMLEAAAYALVGARCRQSYLHDVRGGMQALRSAIELLARAASIQGVDRPLAEKASGLARSAVSKHEKSLVELVNQLAPQGGTAATVNVGELVSDALRFLRNELAAKSITFRAEAAPDVLVFAETDKFRLLILGLISTLVDELAPGGVVDLTVARSDSNALVEFRAAMPCAFIRNPEELLRPPSTVASAFELLLAVTQRWASDHGGRVELSTGSQSPDALRLHYPLAPPDPVAT